MLLEGLGVPIEVFKQYQNMAVTETRPGKAADSLKQTATMLENFDREVRIDFHQFCSFDKPDIFSFPNNEKMLKYAINHVLCDLKNYA